MNSAAAERRLQIAVDIGGTFTDGVLLDEDGDRIWVAKTLTTPSDPGEAISQVIRDLLAEARGDAVHPGAVKRVIHGTTLVTNTLVERRGARVALILTRGTEDCLDIRRELRYDIYDLHAKYPTALVDVADRFALDARIGPDAERWHALDDDELSQVVHKVAHGGYSAAAVCLLHSPVDTGDEQAVKAALARSLPSMPVSLSSEVAREIGEYERMSTVAANAYVLPVVQDYLAAMQSRLRDLQVPGVLHIMLSNGAFTTSELGAQAPIRILESGPAGGVLSGVNCGLAEGITRILAFDMGGTTAKACTAVDGKPAITHVFEFGRVRRFKRGSGLPAVAPSIDLIEIGAGGGSLAETNALGLLQVGPQSAGAEPGPACYAQGGLRATVTDADLILGYLDPESFLGGRMKLDVTRAREALAEAGSALGLDVQETAWGIHDIVNENMAAAARTHIAEKGLDARQFTLVATGGAGPVHAVDVARRLRIPRVLCPVASGVGSCLGFLAAPARADRSWSRVEPLESMDTVDSSARLDGARKAIQTDLADCGLEMADIQWRLSAEIRYSGQGNTVDVLLSTADLTMPERGDILHRFEAEYARLYHTTVPGGVPEVVTWRVSGSSQATVRRFDLGVSADACAAAPAGTRNLLRTDTRRYQEVPVHQRHALAAGTELTGPLVITEPESTLIVAMHATVRVLETLTLQVDLENEP